MTSRPTSSLPRTQRRARYQAPLHARGRALHAHLAKPLRKTYARRAVRLRKGDTVRIMRGKYTLEPAGTVLKHPEGKVSGVDLDKGKVFVEGLTRKTQKGKHKWVPIDPSNLLVIRLDLSDPVRRKRIEGGTKE